MCTHVESSANVHLRQSDIQLSRGAAKHSMIVEPWLAMLSSTLTA